MTNIEVRTQNIYENLSNAEKKVASYFLDNVENVFAKPIVRAGRCTGHHSQSSLQDFQLCAGNQGRQQVHGIR